MSPDHLSRRSDSASSACTVAASVTPRSALQRPLVACFSIQAVADPSVMPRVLEMFAKRGLIPSRWHSDLGGRRRDELTIDLQVEDLARPQAELIARTIRQMVPVGTVLTSEKSFA